MEANVEDHSSMAPQSSEVEEKVCGICEATVSTRGVLDCCDHMFCFSCIEDWATVTNLCPMCKSQFKFVSTVGGPDEYSRIETSYTEKRETEKAFSYFIDEDAVLCLDGNSCKLRAGETDLEDTSVACDACDRWFHACCVDFDASKIYGGRWLCPRCRLVNDVTPALPCVNIDTAKDQTTMEDPSTSFGFTENGESAIVISMVNSSDSATEKEQSRTTKDLEPCEELTSLDKLFDDLARQKPETEEDAEALEDEPKAPDQADELQEDIEGDLQLFSEHEPEDKENASDSCQDPLVADKFDSDDEHSYDDVVDDTATKSLMETGVIDEEKLMELVDDKKIEESEAIQVERKREDENLNRAEEKLKLNEKDKLKAEDEKLEELEVTRDTKKDGVRTRTIMRRETNELSLAEKIRVAAAADGSSQVPNERLLAAYKAAVVTQVTSKQIISNKAPLRGAREKLKQKLYGGLKGRRVYDRDWEVSFWRDKVLGEKRKQPDQVHTEETVERADDEPESILGRVCLADCSLLPKADGANPVPAASKVTQQPKLTEKRKLDTKASDPKPSETNVDNAARDRRQWALELLARKNKQEVRPEHDGLKGKFALLSKLPIDMRPVLEPNPRSKVPSAVRQLHLNRFVELYLKNVTVGRNQACVAAVNAAVAKENEISEKSNSKGVYVNLCARALTRVEALTVEEPQSVKDEETVNKALLAAGLISNSPPGSPDGKEEADLPLEESPRKKVKLDEDSSSSFFGREGINALLEHLRREEIVEPEPSSVASGTKDMEVDALEKQEVQGTVSEHENAAEVGQEIVTSELKEEEMDADKQEKQQAGKQEKEHEEMDVNKKEKKQEEIEVGEQASRKHESKAQDASEDVDDKFSELENRLDRVRSSIAQQMNDTEFVLQMTQPHDKAEQQKSSARDNDKRHRSHSESHGTVKGDSQKASHPPQVKPDANARKQQQAKLDAHKASLSVQQQVEMYIKEHIRPLCKSGVIKADQYHWTVNKTTTKVMQFHKDATSADFLITEGSRVKKLAEQYLQRYALEKKAGKESSHLAKNSS